MQARLTGVDRNEALFYLGYRGGAVPPEIENGIARCTELLLQTARPRLTWRRYTRLADGTFSGTDFRPEGNDVAVLLRDCREAVLFGATLGMEAETLLRRAQVRDMAEAVILDCCANSAIENVCDNFCADLAEEIAPLYPTDRFSPGYGDLPFAQQPDFCRLLELPLRIGVTLTPGGLMLPQKSVTALVGLADRPQSMRFRGCPHCNLFENCAYRKENRSCGKY